MLKETCFNEMRKFEKYFWINLNKSIYSKKEPFSTNSKAAKLIKKAESIRKAIRLD